MFLGKIHCEILDNHLWSAVDKVFGRHQFIFHDDNATQSVKHTNAWNDIQELTDQHNLQILASYKMSSFVSKVNCPVRLITMKTRKGYVLQLQELEMGSLIYNNISAKF